MYKCILDALNINSVIKNKIKKKYFRPTDPNFFFSMCQETRNFFLPFMLNRDDIIQLGSGASGVVKLLTCSIIRYKKILYTTCLKFYKSFVIQIGYFYNISRYI